MHESPGAPLILSGTLEASPLSPPGVSHEVQGAPNHKTRYRIANWPAYDRSLVQRGDLTVWISEEAIASWVPARIAKRGGQQKDSELTIETAMLLRLLFHLPLRQAEGFLRSILDLMGLDLEAPDHTTLCRRSRHLDIELRPAESRRGRHLIGALPITPPPC